MGDPDYKDDTSWIRLENAYANFRNHEHEFHLAIVEAYPVGSSVSYRQGQHARLCRVVRHSQDRIKLIGTMDVEYWKYWDNTFVRVPTPVHNGEVK